MYFNFQPLMPAVQMVLFVWLVVRAVVRGQWRSVIVESGVLSVMTTGTGMMQRWSVSSWDSREQVGCIVVAISNSDSSWTWLLYQQRSRILHNKSFFSLCYDWTRLWILIWKVGPLSVKAKRVCLSRYGNQLVMTPGILISKGQPCPTSWINTGHQKSW